MNPLMIAPPSPATLLGMQTQPIHPAVRIGHLHLRVADLDRSISFYRDTLGFKLVADGRHAGTDAAFLAAGDYHHHLGLNTWDSAGGTPPPPGHTGLYHVALLYPDRRELAAAVERLLGHGHPIDHATDHGATVSVYLADPDSNGIELYYDRPRHEWFDEHGRPILKAERLDPLDLLPTTTTGHRTTCTHN
jgi:catechol 2,3-dioxygenase